jgi:DNA-binding response OmpR family regulator
MGILQGKRILAVDDDPWILYLLTSVFSQTGAQIYTAADGKDGLRQFYDLRPDLVLLDIMMPKLDGWQACARIQDLSNVPVIFLSALARPQDISRGLESGAIDYVVKPFSPQILLARVRAALRQVAAASPPEGQMGYDDGHLAVALDENRVLVQGRQVMLTSTEYRLLAYLCQNAGRVVTYNEILKNVWGWAYRNSVNYVHVYVSYLRKKIEPDPSRPAYIHSERGIGYRFEGKGSHPCRAKVPGRVGTQAET